MSRARHPDEFFEYAIANADLLVRRMVRAGARQVVEIGGIGEPDYDEACRHFMAWLEGKRSSYTDEDVVALERLILTRSGRDYDAEVAEFRNIETQRVLPIDMAIHDLQTGKKTLTD